MSLKHSIRCLTLLSIIWLLACTDKKQEASIREPHRPQFHFSPPSMWMNDPNGMVYYKGEYHLFYQHYPDSTVWGPMHWGHAISRDLVHWDHQPIALYPDSLGMIFSGSAVVDANNTAGFKKGEEDALVAIFTHDKKGYETQGLAYSNDNGRTWAKYENNPVIRNTGAKDFRDPKVFWHNDSEHWVMSLAVGDHIEFYRSKNLKDWTKTGEFGQGHGGHGGVWECPDLFQLPVQGTGEAKWVLLVSINPGGPGGGSATQYFIGNFDGTTFVNQNDPSTELWIDHGRDNYAGVMWSNAPDNRMLFLGWMGNWNYAQVVPTVNWRSAMTLPREVTLENTPEGLRLVSVPVPELGQLRGEKRSISFNEPLAHHGLVELKADFDLGSTTSNDFGVELYNDRNERVRIGFDRTTNRFYVDRTQSGKKDFATDFADIQYGPRVSGNNTVSLHVFADVASVELFADGGTTCMTTIFFPTTDYTQISLYANGGEAKLVSAELYELKPIW